MGFGDDDSGRKRKTLDDEDDMEDDDIEDEEEEDEEEEERGGHGRYNRRVVHFIDEEVAVGDDIEDEDDEEAELSEGELLHEAAEASDKPSHYRRYEAARELPEEEDPERLEEYIKERYFTVQYTAETTAANQQSLVPTQLDSKLWVVQCRPGFERSLCLQLMNKSLAFRKRGTPLLIKSSVSLDHLKGYLYVEADREAHVRDAVQGMRNVQHSKGIKLVPLQEMVVAITPNRIAKLQIDVGTWVRIRNGPYAHDLAKVVQVNLAHQKIDLKVVPRIDYGELVNRQEGRYMQRSRDPFGNKVKVRPLARPFSSEECRSLGLIVERRRGTDGEVYMAVGNYLFQDGYLIKTMSMRSIVVEDSAPPIEELHRFDAAAQTNSDFHSLNEGRQEIPESVAAKRHKLFKGDYIRVLNGDMLSMTGTVAEIMSDGKIAVRMDSKDFSGIVPFDAGDLVKRFEMGDHVCVREGMRRGQSGMVIKIEERKCLILADMDKSEFWVAAKDLSSTHEMHFGHDTFGDYEVEDLVELQHRQFGVIIFADGDFCKVLLAAGSAEKPEVKTATQQEIKCKCEARRNATNDANGNRIVANDIVDFMMGPRDVRTSGTVKYVCPPYVFAKVRQRTENLGYIVISSKLCKVRGGQRMSMSPVGDRFAGLRSPCPLNDARSMTTYSGQSSGRGNRVFLRKRGRAATRDTIMVTIIRGPLRGYRGRIKGETASQVRVELDARSRIVTVLKDDVEKIDTDPSGDISGGSFSYGGGDATSSFSGAPKTPYGDHHPPTTTYLSAGREILTSPEYTPDRTAQTMHAETKNAKQESDDDDSYGFGGDSAPAPPLNRPAAPSVETATTLHSVDLSALSTRHLIDAIVQTTTNDYVVIREASETDDGVCQIEHLTLQQFPEQRSFVPSGEKQRLSLSALHPTTPVKHDWARRLDVSTNDAIGEIVDIEERDNSVMFRAKDAGRIQITTQRHILVILAPSESSG